MSKPFLLAACILFMIASESYSQDLTIATYNLRYANPKDSGNLWVDRAPRVISLIRFHDFDIFGTQEGLKNQLDDISAGLPQYERAGGGRDDGKEKGEHSAVYFKKDMFTLLKKGDFWLREDPTKPGLGWDATCCNRICSWVQLRHRKSGKTFFVFNAHFDHQGVKAREESGKLIVSKIREIAGTAPAIFTGDLNGGHNSAWYKQLAASDLLEDTYTMVQYPYALNASFNAFQTPKSTEIIDHIFVTKHFKVSKWGILTDSYFGKYPSDHFPVVSKLSL